MRQQGKCKNLHAESSAADVAGLVGQVASYPLNIVRKRALVEEQVSESILSSVKSEMRGRDGRLHFPTMFRRMPLGCTWNVGPSSIRSI